MNNPNQLHPQDKRNLIIFMVIAIGIWFGFDSYVLKPRLELARAQQAISQQAVAVTPLSGEASAKRDRKAVLAEGARVKIDNGKVFGSLSLTGARIDDLSLQNYYKTLDHKEHVVLLSPAGTAHTKYAEFGWVSDDKALALPGKDSVWRVIAGDRLAKDSPVTLAFDNGQGLQFERTLSVDDQYMITITERVVNKSGKIVALYPYALVAQTGLPEDYAGEAVVHEGPQAYVDGDLTQKPYRKLKEKNPRIDIQGTTGWIGISDKYWFTSIIPTQDDMKSFRVLYTPSPDKTQSKYQVDVTGAGKTIEAGATLETTTRFFAGAKEIKVLTAYEKSVPIHHFDLAVDFGLYYFLTKPFFYILNFLAGLVGNFGVALICLTILVRLAVFPLANTSFRSFAQMKKIAPQMKELRERFGDDKQQLQAGLVKLYEKEKVNPMAGCLPLLVQIPIFFALYKVLSTTIEMRQAPFFGWIQDLSAHDPLTVFNLFGALPWDPPSFLMIGPWSCLMFLAMLAQKRMSPPPQDPTQAMMANFMPYFITYLLAKFPAGLVIYWTFSNILSVVQQYIIMRSMGVEVHLFKRASDDKEMDKLVAEGPNVHPELEVVEEDVESIFKEEQPKPISKPKPKKKKKK